MRLCRFRYPSSFSSRSRSSASASTLFRSSAMSWAISSAAACPSLMMRLRVRYMRPHDATPTVTATLTAMSQIFVRIVTLRAILHRTYLGLCWGRETDAPRRGRAGGPAGGHERADDRRDLAAAVDRGDEQLG